VTETTNESIKNIVAQYQVKHGKMKPCFIWRTGGNHSPHKNDLIQDSEGNKENRYPVPDSNKTEVNDTKESNGAHKNNLKEEILQVITEKFTEMLLVMVNQNAQEALKKFQDTKKKEYEMTQIQINELIGTLNKH
jgi:hypothetical protein